MTVLAACGAPAEPATVTVVPAPPTTVAVTGVVSHAQDGLDRATRWYQTVVWLDAVEKYEREQAAARARQTRATHRAATPPGPAPRRRVSAVIPDELVAFFECVIDHESATRGVYSAVNPSGKYRGAYQMDASFFRDYAPPEWKHLADSGNWETAPPEVQDAAALDGYRERGPAPWMGICTRYAA